MKTFKKSLISLTTVCFTAISVSASTVVPVEYDFSVDSPYAYNMSTNMSSVVSRTDIDDVRISDGMLKYVMGANENTVNAYITKDFDVPYVAGTIRISFDMYNDGDAFSTTYGFPMFAGDGGSVAVVSARKNNAGNYILRSAGDYLYYSDTGVEVGIKSSTDYHFDIDLNLDGKYYEIYVNNRQVYSGYSSKIHQMPYTCGNLIRFGFGLTSCSAEQYICLDNLTITPIDYNYIYVSGEGNDGGTGTKEAPFRTLERAKEYYKSLEDNSKTIILVDTGSYDITDGITVGEINIFEDKKIPVYPVNNATINMTGTDIIIPELDGLDIKDTFVQNTLQKINETYSDDFYQVMPEFETGVLDGGFTVTTINRGSREYVFQGIMAFFNSNGALEKLNVQDMTAPGASKHTVNLSPVGTYPTIKMFVFDSLKSSIPLAPSQEINGGESTDE